MYSSLQDLFKTRFPTESNDKEISFNLLIRVETGLRLLEVLGMQDQPVLTIWALNQGLVVPALANLKLNEIQKRWLVNYRAVIHRTSKRDWQFDFSTYTQYPENKRVYRLPSDENYEAESLSRTERQKQRINVYDEVFSGILPFRKEKRPLASQGQYGFSYNREYKGEVVFSEKILREARKHTFPTFKIPLGRTTQAYSHQRLRELASEMDRLEQEHGDKRLNKWLDRVDTMIRYRACRPDGSLSDVNTEVLAISGMTHVAGMVGSGKSTIATLIAFDIAKHHPGQRVTLVVADVVEVLRMSEYFNNLLAESNTPVSVPLLGATMRDSHLINVYRQKEFSITSDRWRLRFLDTTCLIKHWLANIDDTVEGRMNPGNEPCNELYELNDKRDRKKNYLCPMFSICPMQQAYRDLVEAPIWVTTMGGLGQAKVPSQVDNRQIPLWLLVYEQSTLVIFDEVDTVQGWFDKLLAPDLVLDDTGAGGLLQDTLRKISNYPSGKFRESTDVDRWRQSYDQTMPALRNFLGLLERNLDLRNWLSVRPFTSLRILFELAGRISGFSLWEGEEAPKEVVDLYKSLQEQFITMQQADLSTELFSKHDEKYELILLSLHIASFGRGEINPATNKIVSAWIKKTMERLPQNIRNEIKAKAEAKSKKPTDAENTGNPQDLLTLTRRLELGLVASALDRDLRGLFYGWHYVEELFGENGGPTLIPPSFAGLLPTPPLGRWRGFRTTEEGDTARKTLSLAVFEYAAVGRYFVQNFDHLLSDLDGKAGPNVLAMSGTSWMPDSAKFHFAVPVAGILEPDKSIQDAVRKSTFTFLPQTTESRNSKNKSVHFLRVSGAGKEMGDNLEQMVLALARRPDKFMSPLARELDKLDQLNKVDPDWEDRARILLIVNSYEQAQIVATILRSSLRSDLAEEVYALVKSNDTVDWDWRPYKAIKRSEVEATGHLARILVAPMGAISRGYNIVSPKTGRAAYGSIYFLIRPMTPPFDAMTMVAGINHKLDEWLNPEHNLWLKHPKNVFAQVSALRNEAREAWQAMERGKFYRLMEEADKKELGASTASSVIQTCGRLVRGGVPFRAFFVDASWVNSKETSEGDFIARPGDSLLAAMIERLLHYTTSDLGRALYGAFSDGLQSPQGFQLDFSDYSISSRMDED